MRILYVNTLFPPDVGGGAELTLAALAAGQQRAGNEVMVVTTTKSGRIINESMNGVAVTRVPLHNFYWHNDVQPQSAWKRLLWHLRDIHNSAMAKSLAAVIAKYNPDLISLHNLVGFSGAAWEVAYKSGKPVVQVLHDYYNLCPRSLLFRDGHNCESVCWRCSVFRIGRARASNRLSAVIGVSRAMLDIHLRNDMFAKVRVRRVINNARAMEQPPPRAYPSTATVFGFIGTVGIWKGVNQLLTAWRAVRAANPQLAAHLRLMIAGSGEATYVDSLVEACAGEQVEFLGHVDAPSFYARIDVLVVPSIWNDPLPGVVFESLLRGVPVIGSTQGGIPEMVTHDINGLLYACQESGALQACLQQLISIPGELGRLGAEARRSSARFADVDRLVAEHREVYEMAVKDANA